MVKRKAADADGDDAGPASVGPGTVGQRTSTIKNKLVRSEKYQKLKHEQKKATVKAEELGLVSLRARQIPKATEFKSAVLPADDQVQALCNAPTSWALKTVAASVLAMLNGMESDNGNVVLKLPASYLLLHAPLTLNIPVGNFVVATGLPFSSLKGAATKMS